MFAFIIEDEMNVLIVGLHFCLFWRTAREYERLISLIRIYVTSHKSKVSYLVVCDVYIKYSISHSK